jgi:hypothetical protein
MKQFADMEINFSLIRVNDSCDKMIKVMRSSYDSANRKLEVQDLAKAINTKTNAEVTKDFVAATSFILSKAIAVKGRGRGKKAAAAVVSDPLWDTKQFEIGQWMSSLAYYNVKAIDRNTITVQNSFGNELQVSKDILEKMHSANHYEHERPMNMTELAELLESAGDTCFTVNFRK